MSEEKKEKDSKNEPKKRDYFNMCFSPLGIHKEDKWYEIHLKRRFFMIIGVLFIMFLLFNAFMFSYTTKPEFCKSCHIMEPYYKAWKTSNHSKVAGCVDCHYPKGTGILPQKMRAMSQVVQYVTRTYRPRPHAEVPDANCLQEGCHQTRLLQGKIKSKQGIMFDHTPHLTEVRRGKQLQCTSCHSQIMVGTHMQVTFTTCYLCHFRDHKPSRTELPLAGCTKCHAPPAEPVKVAEDLTFTHNDYVQKPGVECLDCHLDSVDGNGLAPKERCFDCHNSPERIDQYDNYEFVHKNHVADHKIECGACHLAIQHKIGASKRTAGSCAQCHDQGHDATSRLYAGKWPGTTEEKPSTMSRLHVQCIACHNKREKTEAYNPVHYSADPEACNNCHGEGFSDYIEQWKSDIEKLIAQIEPQIKSLESVVNAKPKEDNERKKLEKIVADARSELDFIRAARGVHNYDLAAEKLNNLDNLLKDTLSKNK